ncbi:hypothetical protein [Flaviflexus equikiangi]|uniref:Uncharacterized protein n=1 Tax=Flaviflexus equikiangi TaxID=2758573 RepID=A0ABS2TE83_9ACTO|nr:hypothetical protein [Flaviflexus equikiangi]MBM9432969.1 hypothetical protein [Flaviflexus equikiangi]
MSRKLWVAAGSLGALGVAIGTGMAAADSPDVVIPVISEGPRETVSPSNENPSGQITATTAPSTAPSQTQDPTVAPSPAPSVSRPTGTPTVQLPSQVSPASAVSIASAPSAPSADE